MDDTYPGIEIRVLPPVGAGEWFIGNSHDLHYELAAAWLHAGCPPDTWQPIAGGNMRLEIRAVDLPALPSGEELLGELAAQDAAAAAAELADVDQAPGHRPCCCHGGFSGDHVCCIHPAAAAADVDQAAAELAGRMQLHVCSSCPSPEGCAAFAECLIGRTLPPGPGQTAAPVPEVDTGAVALTAGQPTRWLAGLGRAIARTARRARFQCAR